MIFHVVKQNESVKDLLFRYGLDKSELISNNQHISDWDMLIPGVKLKIPVVNNNLYEHLEEVEPFIEDYYQKEAYSVDEPVFINNESNLVNDEVYKVDQVPEKNNQTGDVSIPTQEELNPNSQPQNTNQMGDISIPVHEDLIQNSLPDGIESKKEININIVDQPEQVTQEPEQVTQEPEQFIQEYKVNPQIQSNNINNNPVYYRVNPYYRRRVYYDPYRGIYYYF